MVNSVTVQGRLSKEPESRTLPSGDVVWVIRVVVPREPGERAGVDWIDCTVWSGRLFRTVGSWAKDDEVQVDGALRRRFFRVGGQPVSRVEVEARAGRIIRRAALA